VSPELGRTWFRVAFFIFLLSALLLLVVQPGTAEFVITVFTLAIGLIFMVAIVIVARKSK
jgi:hypothetical protein